MAHGLLVGVAPDVLQSLSTALPGFRWDACDPTQAPAQIAAVEADVVVIGSAMPEPIALSQRIAANDPDRPVVILAPHDRLDGLAAAVSVTPLLGRDVQHAPDDDVPALAAAVAKAVDRRQRRSRYRETVEALRTVEVGGRSHAPAEAQYLGQLLDHAPVGVLTVDRHGAIAALNRRASEIVGRTERAAIGMSLYQVFPERQRSRVVELLRASLAGSPDVPAVVVQRTDPLGREQFLELRTAPIAPDTPEIGALVLLHEVTDRLVREHELQLQARHAKLIGEVGLALTSELGLADRLQRCAQALVDNLGAAFARVWTIDDEEPVLVLRASAGLYTHLDGPHSRVPVGALKIGAIAQERRPHLTNHVVGDPRVGNQEWAKREGMVAFAGYPLVVAGRCLGVMAMFARDPLPPSTLQALAAVADGIAVGIQQARAENEVLHVLQRELDARSEAESAAARFASLAHTLQQSLLPPSLPMVPGIDCAARYRWAGDGTVIGGDFYDLFAIDESTWACVIGDVSGKGVQAASFTSMVRHTVRALARGSTSPADTLRRVNAAIVDQVGPDRFCTLALAFLTPTEGRIGVVLACAGHPFPFVTTSDGRVHEIGRAGNPMGLLDDPEVEDVSHTLLPGETMVLYTDGLVEARSPAGEFAPGLGPAVLARVRDWSAHDIVGALESSVMGFERGQPRDDLALLVVRAATAPRRPPSMPLGEVEGELFEVVLDAQPESVPQTRRALSRWLARQGVTGAAADDVELGTSELLTNAVRAARSKVGVRVWWEDRAIVVEVRDDGYGMGLPARTRAPLAEAAAEYGRGWPMIESLFDDLRVSTSSEGTVVTCRRVVRPDETP